MLHSYKCTSVFSRNVWFKNFLISHCFSSQENNQFVNKTKRVERLKTSGAFTPLLYEKGKYIFFLRSDYVCVENGNKLMLRDFEDVKNLRKFGNVIITFLDILTDSKNEVYLFAANLQVGSDTDARKINVGGRFVNTLRTMFFLSKSEAQLVTHSRGLLHFHTSHKFCSYCGGSLQIKEGGHQKLCTNCKCIHYPNVSPIGITLVEDEGHTEVLLVRQQNHPPGMYTCISGFIEPGESLEDNARREVAEEVGLPLSNVEYHVSQHWALPSSQLILGCFGTASSKNLDVDEKEIVDAKWVTAEELKMAVTMVRDLKNSDELQECKFWAPPCNTVSHSLMVGWLIRHHDFNPPPC